MGKHIMQARRTAKEQLQMLTKLRENVQHLVEIDATIVQNQHAKFQRVRHTLH